MTACCAVALIGLTAADSPAPLPRASLVLFWASWCAPCRAEIGQINRLAEAAKPYRTLVLATEDNSRSRAMLATVSPSMLQVSDESLWALYRWNGIKGPVALPLSVMTDADGRVCATIRGGATASAIEAAKQACAVAR